MNQNHGIHGLLATGFIIEHWTVGDTNRRSVNTCSKHAVYFGNFTTNCPTDTSYQSRSKARGSI